MSGLIQLNWSGVANLILLALVLLVGAAVVDQKRAVWQLKKSLIALRGPRVFRPEGGMPLPELEAISAQDRRRVGWPDYFPAGRGIALMLDPDKEECWRLGLEIGHYKQQWTKLPLLVLVLGDIKTAVRFVHKTAIAEEIVALAGDWDGLGPRILPHALAVEPDLIAAGAHVLEMAQLQTFEVGLTGYSSASCSEPVIPKRTSADS